MSSPFSLLCFYYHVCCQNSKPLMLQFTALIYYAIHTWSQGNYIARPLHCAFGFSPKTDLCALLPEKPIQPFQKMKCPTLSYFLSCKYKILLLLVVAQQICSEQKPQIAVGLCSKAHHLYQYIHIVFTIYIKVCQNGRVSRHCSPV